MSKNQKIKRMMRKQKMNNIDYLFCKGILDFLLNKNLITIKEHKEIDALNKKKLKYQKSLIS